MNGAPGAIVRGHPTLLLGPSLEPRIQTIDFLFPLLVVLPELSQLGASTDGVDRIPRVRRQLLTGVARHSAEPLHELVGQSRCWACPVALR